MKVWVLMDDLRQEVIGVFSSVRMYMKYLDQAQPRNWSVREYEVLGSADATDAMGAIQGSC